MMMMMIMTIMIVMVILVVMAMMMVMMFIAILTGEGSVRVGGTQASWRPRAVQVNFR